MAGLNANTPIPSGMVVHKQSRALELQYDDGESFFLPFEYLRVYSPSAEVRGHHRQHATLQAGKRDVTIKSIAAVGNYAIQPTFSDGHASGIYSWDYLYELAISYDARWQKYLDELAAASLSRDAVSPPSKST